MTVLECWGHAVLCVLGKECAKKLTLTLHEIERTQIVGHQIKVDWKIDPAHAHENMHIHTHTTYGLVSDSGEHPAVPDADFEPILKTRNLCNTLMVAGQRCSSTE